MMKGTIQQVDISLVDIYAPNIGAPKYVKEILMDIKGETERNSQRTPLTSIDRSSRQKMNKETAALYDTLEQMDLNFTFSEIFTPKQQTMLTF